MPAATLKRPMKAGKPNAPKKPSSKSKTGNAECSAAASNWQLSIRGKASLNGDTYTTLAKCRAMTATKRQAGLREASGKLSEQGKVALESRLTKRFESGLVTQKSRTARLEMLMKQRAERGKTEAKPVDPARSELAKRKQAWRKEANAKIAGSKHYLEAMDASSARKAGYDPNRESRAVATGMTQSERSLRAVRINRERSRRDESLIVERDTYLGQTRINARINHDQAKTKLSELRTQRKLAQPPKYSLGGKLAPGRGNKRRTQVAKDLLEIRDAMKNGDMSRIARVADRSLDVKAIPSKYDTSKIAILDRYPGARWQGMTVSQLRRKMTEPSRNTAFWASKPK